MASDSKINIRKRKETTFIAESLDNTAPVKKILEYLQSKNSTNKVYTYYCQTIRQRRTTHGHYWKNLHFLLPGHPLNAFNDDWDGGLNSGYFEALPYRSLMPTMATKLRNIERQDPLAAQMKTKMEWQEKLVDYKRIIGQISKKNKYKWISDDLFQCPKVYVDVAAHWERNPDPYFECSYNWYYAGHGNMQMISYNGLEYLLHSEFSCMYLLPYYKTNETIEFDDAISFDCGEGVNIYETICSAQNIVALRTKNKIFVLKIVETDKIELEKLKEMESTLPFTGVSFDDFHKNILYVTNIDNTLTIVNVDRMTGRTKDLKGKSSLVDNWSTVLGSERGYYTHIARNSLTLYDKRTNNPFERWKGIRNLTDDVSCNDISVAKHCEGTPYLYFGTDHHLFLMDMRYKSNKNKLKAVQRWTHGMQCLPTYMKLCNFEYNKELICLSSQWCEDMCVISNYADRMTRQSDIRGVTIPYRPQSLLNVLNETQQKMLCCDIYDPIDSRLCTAVTGLMVTEHGENYSVLMQNSLGDISSHVLYPEHMASFIEDDSIKRLDEWSRCYKHEKKDFEVSSITDFSKVWRQLKKVPENYTFIKGNSVKDMKFNEQEIIESFNNEELDVGLKDIWINNQNETKTEVSELKLFYSDDE